MNSRRVSLLGEAGAVVIWMIAMSIIATSKNSVGMGIMGNALFYSEHGQSFSSL